MQGYTLAFIFNENLTEVLLIEKQRPFWQKGFLNGIGGKCEINEEPLDCINREVFEECNLSNVTFREFGIIDGEKYMVHVYCASINNDYFYHRVISMTDEKVGVYSLDKLNSYPLLPSVKYLIPMALQPYIDPKFKTFYSRYE